MQQNPWGGQIQVEVSSAAPDADPVWVDISDYVIVPGGQTIEAQVGRVTELDEPEPGNFSLTLNNRDHRFTPGNTTSPYYPWWKQARRIRGRELVGYSAFPFFDGYVEIPEVDISLDVEGDANTDIVVTLTGVDQLGRSQNGRKMVSTLGEYILANRGPSLKAYYPLNEDAGPFIDVSGNGYPSMTPVAVPLGPIGSLTEAPQYLPANTAPPGGDDKNVLAVTMATSFTGTQWVTSGYMETILDLYAAGMAIPVAAGQVATIAVWVKPDLINGLASNSQNIPVAAAYNDGASLVVSDYGIYDSDGTILGGFWYSQATGMSNLVGRSVVHDNWSLIAIRLSFSPQTVEFWVDDQPALSGTWSSGSPSTLSLAQVYLPRAAVGAALAHAQIYVGATTDWTHADHVAQYAMGTSGLTGQTTGERINTVLDYLGFPSGRRDIDPGVATMPNAALGGKDGLSALQEAVDTERGRLFASGGRIVFRDRRTVYDV